MKDKIGQELSFGDKVVFNPPTYKGLKFGKVLGFTPQMVKLEYNSSGKQTSDITRTEPFNVVKVPPVRIVVKESVSEDPIRDSIAYGM